MEDFSKAPVSIGEKRGMDDCRAWSPRELLVYLLRGLDNGTFQMDEIVVLYAFAKDGGVVTGMKRSKSTVRNAVALCEMAKFDLLTNTGEDV